ncbi:DUF3237 family protein [Piscinibacter sakaiensis]|uniref:DUF3237 family protein n=1 Tax=Piscinibacter sakaiensis TaxID=1547922 RepID=UPI00372628CE
MTPDFPTAPPLWPMTRVECRVRPLVSLGPGKHGERRYVPLAGGRVAGPELNGEILDGGVDWQVQRADGVLEIAAHYVLRLDDGALVEVQSDGVRHAPPEVMAALARGEPLPREAYYFRTLMRFQTGAPAWQHLNRLGRAAAPGRGHAPPVQSPIPAVDRHAAATGRGRA